jgi:transposase
MNQVTTIGLDIAKSIFQLHGVDAGGRSVLRRRLSRSRVWSSLANCHDV